MIKSVASVASPTTKRDKEMSRKQVVSDGQLRRMQLALKLMPPRSVVFLDEASVDLDIIGRQVGRPGHTLSDAHARCCGSTCFAHVLLLLGSQAVSREPQLSGVLASKCTRKY